MNVDQFREAIRSAGLEPPEVIEPGKLHRFTTNGKGSDDAGWCKLFADDGGGVFGDFRSGLSETWQAQREKPFTPAERESFRRRCEAERRAREAEEAHRHAEAARNASSIWKTSTPTSSTHRYVAHKQIAPVESLRDIDAAEAARILGYAPKYRDGALAGRLLVVPIKVASELSSVEFIDEAGRKSALYGRPKKGGYWEAQDLPDGDGAGLTLLIGEGVATVLSAREATGYLVIAALSCGNLLAVTREMRKRFPAAKLGVLADLGNGKDKAEEAARATSSVLVLPDFGPNPPDGLTDFNDMHQHRGWEAIAECIRRQMATSSAQDGTPPGSQDAPGSDSQGKARAEDATGEAEDLEATVRRLAELAPIAYDRVRQAEADALGVRVATLDAEVGKAREAMDPSDGASVQGQAVVFDDPEPWTEEVDGAAAIDEASKTVSRRVALPDGAADAMALWTVHAHCHTAFLHSPRLNLTSPEKGCGKTLALDVLYSLAPKGIRTESITTAVLFRIVDKFAPTLFVDEYDAFIHDNEELRGALNAGHKRGGMHLRCEGDQNEVRGFRTFAPVALAGIRELPGTLSDRSIVIRMQRMAADEHREPFDQRRTEPENILCRKLARWARDNFQALEAADPEMPAGTGHRVRDNWRPLFAIANQAGGDWPTRVRRAFDLLAKPDDAARSRAEMLLSDIRKVFTDRGVNRISSEDLVIALLGLEGRTWAEYSRGKPLTKAKLARLLRPFGVVSGSRRLPDGTTPKGYLLDQFVDAFKRYLPPLEDPRSDRSQDPSSPGDPHPKAQQRHKQDGARVSEDFENATAGGVWHFEDGPEPSGDAGCGVVADSNPPYGGEEGDRETGTI